MDSVIASASYSAEDMRLDAVKAWSVAASRREVDTDAVTAP